MNVLVQIVCVLIVYRLFSFFECVFVFLFWVYVPMRVFVGCPQGLLFWVCAASSFHFALQDNDFCVSVLASDYCFYCLCVSVPG